MSIIIDLSNDDSGITIETVGGGGVTIENGDIDNLVSGELAALSVRIDNVSTGGGGSGSVTSQEFSALSARVNTNSAQMTSVGNALSIAIGVVSNSLSVETVNRASADAALSARIDAISGVGGSGSVTSQELSVAIAAEVSNRNSAVAAEISNRTSADNSLSARIAQNSTDMVSTDNNLASAIRANSTVLSNLQSAIQVNSAQMTSADGALSVRIDTVSNAISAKTISSLIGVSINGATDQQVLTYNSADGKWHASTVAAGAGSVTSTELSAASAAAASAISIVSAAVVSVNNRISAISATVSSNSAQMTSADNAISAAAANAHSLASQAFSVASAVSAAQATTSAAVTSVNNRVSGISTTVTNNSAQMTSADNAISNAVSIVSVAAANAHSLASQAFSVASAVSAAQAATSAAVTSVNNRVSGISTTVTNNSAQMTSADNAISNAVSVLSAYVNKAIGSEFAGGNISATSATIDFANGKAQAFSILGNTPLSIVSTTLSAGANYLVKFQQDGTGSKSPTWPAFVRWPSSVTPVLGGASAVDIMAFYYGGDGILYGQHNAISVTVGGGSVTSTELSAAVAVETSNRISADNGLSVRIDTVSNAVSIVSNALSAASAQVASIVSAYLTNLGQTQLKVVGNIQSVSATALTNVSGLSISVVNGGVYEIAATILHRASTAAGHGFGLTFPGMVAAGGHIKGAISIGAQTPASGQLSGIAHFAVFNENASGSVVLSAGTGNSGTLMTRLDGLFNVSTAGTIQMQIKTSAGVVAVQPGSFIRAYRIV